MNYNDYSECRMTLMTFIKRVESILLSSVKADAGGKTEANAYLEQMHKAYPLLKDHCLDSHCTFGVVNNIINDKLTRVRYRNTLCLHNNICRNVECRVTRDVHMFIYMANSAVLYIGGNS